MKKIVSVVMFLIFLSSTSHAIDAGTAKGTLSVGKEKVALTQCFAHEYRDAEGLGNGPELRVLLSDREVPQSMLAGYDGPMKLDRLARAGELRGVLLKLDPKDPGAGMSGTILMPPEEARASMLFFTVTGGDAIRDVKVGGNRISGKADYRSEKSDVFKEMKSFAFKASFDAPLFHDEPFEKRLSGPAAAKSPPARALLAYFKALMAGDFAGAEKLATPGRWREIEAARAQRGDVEFVGMINQMENLRELSRSINRVLIRGSRAVIVIKEKGSRSSQAMRQEEGAWKVD